MSANFDAVLFEARRATYFLLSEWRNRGPLIPLQPTMDLLEPDRTKTVHFDGAWRAAFPDRDPLPNEPLAETDGRGTEALWDAMR